MNASVGGGGACLGPSTRPWLSLKVGQLQGYPWASVAPGTRHASLLAVHWVPPCKCQGWVNHACNVRIPYTCNIGVAHLCRVICFSQLKVNGLIPFSLLFSRLASVEASLRAGDVAVRSTLRTHWGPAVGGLRFGSRLWPSSSPWAR